MDEDSRLRRRRRSRTARPECCHAGGKDSYDALTGLTTIHDLTDDLLELDLLQVSSPVTLVRAAAACRPWRRLISGAGFLRRHRSLHPPLVLGHYYAGRGTAFIPKTSPPGESAAAVDDGRVSLGFLPRGHDARGMELTDSRGGLLAFVRYDSSIVVCDPLARRFTEVYLPATPASEQRFSPCLGAFFLDAGAGAAAGDTLTTTMTSLSMSNFRVLCVPVACDDKDDRLLTARSFVFSARDSRWLLLNSTALQANTCQFTGHVEPYIYRFLGRTDGIVLWSVVGTRVLHLDESTGEFSTFALPGELPPANVHWDWDLVYERCNLRAVGRDGTGAVRLARIVGRDLEVLRCVPTGGGGGDVVRAWAEEELARPARVAVRANVAAAHQMCA